MKQECLSCRNAFKFFDGECECIYEPEVFYGKRKKDNDCCEKYNAVEKTAYEERLAWKLRQEKEHLVKNIKNAKENEKI
jgi:hypothetical protein